MPIATASGTANGPAPAPSHVPTVPTGNHAIIRLSIAKATASQGTRNQPVEVAVVKTRCALAASVQKRHRTTELGTAAVGRNTKPLLRESIGSLTRRAPNLCPHGVKRN